MKTKQSIKVSGPYRAGARQLVLGAVFAATMLGASVAQAFPALGLTPGLPDISSPVQIDVSYIYDANMGFGTLSAMGGVSQLNLPPSQGISNGMFNLIANLDVTNTTVIGGSLSITGTSGSFSSGTLLTANLTTFGAGANDPLEFLFDNIGGDLAGVFGSTAGVILSNSGYTGSLTTNFNSVVGAASADTFGQPSSVPEPGTLALMLLGGVLCCSRRTRKAVLVTH